MSSIMEMDVRRRFCKGLGVVQKDSCNRFRFRSFVYKEANRFYKNLELALGHSSEAE